MKIKKLLVLEAILSFLIKKSVYTYIVACLSTPQSDLDPPLIRAKNISLRKNLIGIITNPEIGVCERSPRRINNKLTGVKG